MIEKNDSIIKKIILIDIASIILAYFLFNYLDILTTDYQWIMWMRENGFLHIYDSWDIRFPIDYPPLYVGWLYLIRNIVGDILSNYTQLVMKSLPLMFQFISQIYIYRKISPKAALNWSLNSAILFNVVVYGQRDGIIGLLFVLFYMSLKKNKWFEPGLIITVFCLLKPQGFYLCFPLILYYIINKTPVKKVLLTIVASVSLGYIAFIPFAITTRDWLISIKVYLFAFKRHPVFASVAGNIWGPFDLCDLPDWLGKMSLVLILLCMVISIYIYVKTKDFIYTSIMYMLLLFMITLAQHGRYSIYTMFIMFIAIYMHNQEEYSEIYKLLTISAALAQVGMILYNRYAIFYAGGLHVVESTVEITYLELYSLYGVRLATVGITLIINLIVCYKLIKLKRVPKKTLPVETE